MRLDNRIDSRAFLFLLLAATSLGCSCKSMESRFSEDKAAMIDARQKIKSKSLPVITKHEDSLKDEHSLELSKLSMDLGACREEKAQKEKRINELENPPKPVRTPPSSPYLPR